MNKKNKNYLYSILGTPKQLLGKHLGKEEEGWGVCKMCGGSGYASPFEDSSSGDCERCYGTGEYIPEKPKSPLKIGKGWKKIFKIR